MRNYCESIRLRINRYFRKKYAHERNKELINRDFTIISNNCWAGMIYESYNLPKNTPTVGLFIMPKDYLKFISNLKEYMKYELIFINPNDSNYCSELSDIDTYGSFPIARLGDIEIFFLHYKDENEAKEKWNRRKKRINYNNIIYKFNDQNGCTDSDINDFFQLKLKNKIFFTCKNVDSPDDCVCFRVKQIFNHKFVTASHETFGKPITEYLNSLCK